MSFQIPNWSIIWQHDRPFVVIQGWAITFTLEIYVLRKEALWNFLWMQRMSLRFASESRTELTSRRNDQLMEKSSMSKFCWTGRVLMTGFTRQLVNWCPCLFQRPSICTLSVCLTAFPMITVSELDNFLFFVNTGADAFSNVTSIRGNRTTSITWMLSSSV